ncbi:uncharacterized protein LOC119376744 [Rhipicephalus sanguineus]|uniref:uncharacterized protein LOC119376744 n=1 Tax=Rhipicephalus sanguineus TaxID=34632 RepID=UPI0020C553E3|nr:uncharacterized protein LOC119376744 [Rhipicephalus sanguineus]
MLVQDKATRRIDVQRSLMETAEGIKTSYDQYELEFQEGGFPDGVRGVGGHHCGGPYIRLHPGRRQLSLLREAYAAKHACNMGGIVLISNAGLMWATCAFIPVLLTFCFPLAAMLEAYVCEPYDEQDGTSLDGAAQYLFNIPKGKLFQYFTPSNILGKCNEKTAYAGLSHLSLSPLEELNAQRFRQELFDKDGTQSPKEYVKSSTIKAVNKYAKTIMTNVGQDHLMDEESVKTLSASTDKLVALKDRPLI